MDRHTDKIPLSQKFKNAGEKKLNRVASLGFLSFFVGLGTVTMPSSPKLAWTLLLIPTIYATCGLVQTSIGRSLSKIENNITPR